MYQRLTAVLFPIMAALLVGTGLWGYQEHQEKNSILIKAENQYQRAFHDLTYYMDQLHTELGKAMAVSNRSEQYQKRELIQVWRMTSQAQNQISQLPLVLLPFNKTEEFLDKISSFAYRASLRDLTKNPLTESEFKTLKTLYDRSDELSKQLRGIQTKALKDHLRWMDVELALASESNQIDNAIIDGFKLVDQQVNEYSEVDWGPSVHSLYEIRSMNALSGPKMTVDGIRRKAAEFLGDADTSQMTVTENGKGTEYASFSVSLDLADKETVQMDFSQRGGYLLWFIKNREVAGKSVSPEQAAEKAEQFLRKHNYTPVVPVNYDEYSDVCSVTFAAVEDGTTYYPRKATVKVALDNGEIIGLQAGDYLFENERKTIAASSMTMAEAAKFLNPAFRRTGGTRAYIKNDFGEKVLCYEFTGRINGGHYRIFLNAETGEEEKVETLQPIEAAFRNKK